MTSKVIYNGDLRTTMTHLQSGQEVITDAPTDNHGKGEAFSPTDMFCTAWASCMMTTMAIAAKNRDWSVAGMHAEVTKIMSSSGPRRIAGVDVIFYMPELAYNDEQKTLLERAAKGCPISKSVSPEIIENISFSWA